MAHTVQSLSKLLKKTEEEVITILANAGIEGKAADLLLLLLNHFFALSILFC
jgi:translation initiation factor IF-2